MVRFVWETSGKKMIERPSINSKEKKKTLVAGKCLTRLKVHQCDDDKIEKLVRYYPARISSKPLKNVMSHPHILKSPYFPLVCSTGIVHILIISQNVHKSHEQ